MDFTVFQGDTKRIHFSLKQDDGSPLELVGASIRWQVSRLKAPGVFSSTPLIAKSEQNGVEIDDELNGFVTVTLMPEETAELKGEFYMELEVEDASGDISTVHTGSFEVKKALIKPAV